MNSFISWIGGKKRLREAIVARFPMNYDRYIWKIHLPDAAFLTDNPNRPQKNRRQTPISVSAAGSSMISLTHSFAVFCNLQFWNIIFPSPRL